MGLFSWLRTEFGRPGKPPSSSRGERSTPELTKGVFRTMPTWQQIAEQGFPLEWEEEIPDFVSGIKCACGKHLQFVRKHAVHEPSDFGPGFLGRTYVIAECSCSCGKKCFVATVPNKIQKHWIGQ